MIVIYILNLPWTTIGLLMGLISKPQKIRFQQGAIIIYVKVFWWAFGYMKGMRAATIGNVVLLGQKLDPFDLAHELVHVRQYNQYPFIFPLLYYWELFVKGYINNRFEKEAYKAAGNNFVKKD